MITRIDLNNPPEWATKQMEYVSSIAELQEIADNLGWELDTAPATQQPHDGDDGKVHT